jgi:hypothetical protein
MRDVDVGMRAVIRRGHDLTVLPDTEDQRQQEYQSRCQKGDSGVDAQMPVHCPAESS